MLLRVVSQVAMFPTKSRVSHVLRERERESIQISFLRSRRSVFSFSLSDITRFRVGKKVKQRDLSATEPTMNRHHDPNPFDEEDEEIVNPFSVNSFSLNLRFALSLSRFWIFCVMNLYLSSLFRAVLRLWIPHFLSGFYGYIQCTELYRWIWELVYDFSENLLVVFMIETHSFRFGLSNSMVKLVTTDIRLFYWLLFAERRRKGSCCI